MNIKCFLFYRCITLLNIILLYSCNNNNNFILNENFDFNKLAWVEESSLFHCIKIDSGYYYISNRDSSTLTSFTSVTSLDKSYLYSLPNSFEICTKIKLINNKHEVVSFGIILYGASLRYSFNIINSGKILVYEYDYNSTDEELLLSVDSEFSIDKEVICKIIIKNFKFKFFIDDYEVGESRFNVKTLQELRLFTSKESTIAVDYLTIKTTNI